jgi:hypothetical protein
VVKSGPTGVWETMAPSSKPTDSVRSQSSGLAAEPGGGPGMAQPPSPVSNDSTVSPGSWTESTNAPSPWIAQSLA